MFRHIAYKLINLCRNKMRVIYTTIKYNVWNYHKNTKSNYSSSSLGFETVFNIYNDTLLHRSYVQRAMT
jgi:hypothetical protein